MRNCTIVLALFALVLGMASVASAGAIVYESFNYPTGGLNGNTAESGLAAWAASGTDITSPGLTYTDGHGNVLPAQGNKTYQDYKADSAAANILTAGWSPSSVDGTRLNNNGATIWWSFLYDWHRRDGWECHRTSLESTNGGYVGLEDTTSGSGTSITFAGMNDDGTKVTYGSYNMTGTTFVLMKLATDTSGNTDVDMWFDPLLDGGEAGLGTTVGSITISADGGDGVLHFDRIRQGQIGHSATYSIDEIRMGETFNSVVGLPDAGIEVGATAGTWVLTRQENPEPDMLEVDKTAVDMGPFDMEITVTGGLTAITIDETVLNPTMVDWTDYHVQLGTGLGDDFEASTPGDGLLFVSGTSATFPTLTWLSEDELAFSGSIVGPLNSDDLLLQLQLPGADPYTFTLRQWPTTTVIPEPSTLVIWALGLLGLGFYGRRRKR